MSYDEIEKTWHSPLNEPSRAQLEKDKQAFTKTLRKQHHGLIIFCTLTFAALAFITLKILFHTISPDPKLDNIDFAREWGIIPFMALPWVGWGYMVRQLRRHLAKHENYEVSIQSSLRALLDENRMARMRAKFIAGLMVATMLVLPLVIQQIKAVGKAGNEINAMYVLAPAVFAAVLVGMVYNYRRTLVPKRAELEQLLQSYEVSPLVESH